MAPTSTPPGPPITRRLALIVGLFALTVGCLLVLFNVQIGVLWAVRGYVGGESLWSKGQKDAAHHLVRYAATRDPAEYDRFRDAITIPLGDRQARLELEQPKPDLARVRDGFIAGHNHPEDIDGMIALYRNFRHTHELGEAIRIWSVGDHFLLKIVRYGNALHDEIASAAPDPARIHRLIGKIERVNARVTPLEEEFSRTLGGAARRVRAISIGVTFLAATALLLIATLASWLILKDARRHEDALRESEARYRGLFEDLNEAMYLHDFSGRFIDLNKAAEALSGYTSAEARGLSIYDLVVPEHRALVRGMLERTARDRRATRYELVIVARDGRRVPLEVSARAIVRDDRPVAVQAVARDITERQRVEAERAALLERERAAREAAELANRTKDEFLAMLSHELRTPLTAILTWVHLLRGGRLDAAARANALDVIERNTKLQTALISDLLDVSRIIAGKIRLRLVPVDPAVIVSTAVDALRTGIEKNQLQLGLRIDTHVGSVHGDPDRLQQVVANLVSNAIKFTPRGGRIEVGVAREGGAASIWVRDDGIGITSEFLPQLFEPFRQADSSDTRAHGGLGLGLAIVRHLVELHGGTVTAESAGPGAGAIFRVRLPLVAGAAAPPPASLRPTAAARRDALLRGVDVLVVDDDADTRGALRAALEQHGARVRVVPSAPDALAALEQKLPDVLLCDLDMPGETGLELLRTLRAREPARGGDIPAAAITAHARQEDAERALAAGFERHLPKPVDPLTLACTVAELAVLPHLDRAAR